MNKHNFLLLLNLVVDFRSRHFAFRTNQLSKKDFPKLIYKERAWQYQALFFI